MATLAFLLRVILYKLIFGPILRLIIGVKFRNHKNLNFDKPKLIVANHNSHIDAVAILCSLKMRDLRRVHPVVARDYFYKNFITKFFAKVFLNSVSVSRSKEFENPLANCEALLEKGHSLIIFPEGTRGAAGKMKEFKLGAAILLSKHSEVEFIPAYCDGFGDIMPKGDWLILPFGSSIQFGSSISVSKQDEDVKSITQKIRDSILELKPIDKES